MKAQMTDEHKHCLEVLRKNDVASSWQARMLYNKLLADVAAWNGADVKIVLLKEHGFGFDDDNESTTVLVEDRFSDFDAQGFIVGYSRKLKDKQTWHICHSLDAEQCCFEIAVEHLLGHLDITNDAAVKEFIEALPDR